MESSCKRPLTSGKSLGQEAKARGHCREIAESEKGSSRENITFFNQASDLLSLEWKEAVFEHLSRHRQTSQTRKYNSQLQKNPKNKL